MQEGAHGCYPWVVKIEQPPEGYWREIYGFESQIFDHAKIPARWNFANYAEDRWATPSIPDAEPGLDNEITSAIWKARRGFGLSFGSVAVNRIIRPDAALLPDEVPTKPTMQNLYGYFITPWFLGRPELRVHKTGLQDWDTDTDEALFERQQGWKEARKMGLVYPTEDDYKQFKFVMQIGASGRTRY